MKFINGQIRITSELQWWSVKRELEKLGYKQMVESIYQINQPYKVIIIGYNGLYASLYSPCSDEVSTLTIDQVKHLIKEREPVKMCTLEEF